MVLVNTHPDYMQFDGAPSRHEFPASLYEDLLRYVQEKYAGTFWSALPREVSQYYRSTLPESSRNTRRKICMLTHSVYESDIRVQHYAEALAQRGDLVDVIAIHAGYVLWVWEDLRGFLVHRVPGREWKKSDKWRNALQLLRFMIASSWVLTRRHHWMRYDLIHVHNVPGFFVHAAWYPKWTEAQLILDSEAIDNRGNPATGLRRDRALVDGRIQVLCPSTLQQYLGADTGIRAFARVKKIMPNAELHLYSEETAATRRSI